MCKLPRGQTTPKYHLEVAASGYHKTLLRREFNLEWMGSKEMEKHEMKNTEAVQQPILNLDESKKMGTDNVAKTSSIVDQASVITNTSGDHKTSVDHVTDKQVGSKQTIQFCDAGSTSNISVSTLPSGKSETPIECKEGLEKIESHVSFQFSGSLKEEDEIHNMKKFNTEKEPAERDSSVSVSEICHMSFTCKESLEEHTFKPIEGNTVINNSEQQLIGHLKSSLASALKRSAPEQTEQLLLNAKNELFSCAECPWASSSDATLQKHMTEKHSNSSYHSDRLRRSNACYSRYKPFQCHFCQMCFFKKTDLKAHLLIHYEEEHLRCKICNTTFNDYKALKAHVPTHEQQSSTCEICGKTFTQAGNMRIHMRSHRTHIKDKPSVCKMCGKKYSRELDLKHHMRQHTNEKRFLCEVCGKAFNSSSNLARHNKVHTQEKPFSCVVCEKLFAHSHHLKKHYRIHTQEKPYSCEFCGKAFREVDYLKEHLRVHTKEKPYLCRICGKGFSQAGSVKLHQRVHTRQAYGNGGNKNSTKDSNYEVLIPAEEDDEDDMETIEPSITSA